MSTSNPAEIRRAIEVLVEPGSVVELRAPKSGKYRTVSGYFNDPAKAAKAAVQWSGKAPGVYFTLNPVNPALLARAANTAKTYAETTAQDPDILRRR
jgi:hypothetical protein